MLASVSLLRRLFRPPKTAPSLHQKQPPVSGGSPGPEPGAAGAGAARRPAAVSRIPEHNNTPERSRAREGVARSGAHHASSLSPGALLLPLLLVLHGGAAVLRSGLVELVAGRDGEGAPGGCGGAGGVAAVLAAGPLRRSTSCAPGVRACVRACEGPCAGLRAAAGQASVECNDGGVKGQRLRRNAHI